MKPRLEIFLLVILSVFASCKSNDSLTQPPGGETPEITSYQPIAGPVGSSVLIDGSSFGNAGERILMRNLDGREAWVNVEFHAGDFLFCTNSTENENFDGDYELYRASPQFSGLGGCSRSSRNHAAAFLATCSAAPFSIA